MKVGCVAVMVLALIGAVVSLMIAQPKEPVPVGPALPVTPASPVVPAQPSVELVDTFDSLEGLPKNETGRRRHAELLQARHRTSMGETVTVSALGEDARRLVVITENCNRTYLWTFVHQQRNESDARRLGFTVIQCARVAALRASVLEYPL